MIYLIGLVLFSILAILQSTIVSTMPLLKGTADLFLLFIVAWALQDRVETAWQWCLIGGVLASVYSGLPFGVFILAYLFCVGIARLIKRRIWKAPFLAMLAATFVSTMIVQILSMVSRMITGVNILIMDMLNLILVPSMLLNLILAIPVFSVMHDMARWLYPEELEA
ncbi:MAG TPA: rod shape-determining protein MreD [Anaerolineales bacterium]|nr:rod shape-determining protein MreD [Anaerolineales bacterium]